MNAIDTNILIYVHDPRDPVKRAKAGDLVEFEVEGVLLWQVACEYISASRKLEPFGYSIDQAWRDIRDLRMSWTTALPDWRAYEKSEQMIKQYQMSFWDATIVAACLVFGCERLYSEDICYRPKIEGLALINPFK